MKNYLLLGSRIALGVYVPAVSIKKQLEINGISADLLCIEDLYSGRDEVIEETKRSLHKDFSLARMSYRLPTRNKSAIDPEKESGLLKSLTEKKYDKILFFSGFWLELLHKLLEKVKFYKGRIYAIHMDAEYSLSWKGEDHSCAKEIWLYNLERNRVEHVLENVNGDVRENDRFEPDTPRILVHGGGWGIGEYQDKIRLLNELGYGLDIILYYEEEYPHHEAGGNRYFLLDPGWRPDEERKEYPRLLCYEKDVWRDFGEPAEAVNPLRKLINNAAAILSKPGGGTLSDSFITATPLLFGEALAGYERANRQLWVQKGFGIGFDDFVRTGSPEILMKMKRSILKEQKAVSHIFEAL